MKCFIWSVKLSMGGNFVHPVWVWTLLEDVTIHVPLIFPFAAWAYFVLE